MEMMTFAVLVVDLSKYKSFPSEHLHQPHLFGKNHYVVLTQYLQLIRHITSGQTLEADQLQVVRLNSISNFSVLLLAKLRSSRGVHVLEIHAN